MTTTALSCGGAPRPAEADDRAVRWVDLPATPGRELLDPLLAEHEGHLLVQGTDADLAAVVLRLLRKNRLSDVTVGYLPVSASPATRLWNLPTGAAGAELALRGRARPAPLIRDDNGGILVASGSIAPITGQVYCDDQQVLHGSARSLEVAPDPAAEALPEPAPPEPTADPQSAQLQPALDGLRVTAVRRGFPRRRRTVARGRAAQASFRSATVLRDGVEHPRPAEQWGWYRHTEDLRLVRGASE